MGPGNCCYRTFRVMCWFRSLPSAQQACRSFFRFIYAGGPLKGTQLTTTADRLTLTRYSVLSSVVFVNDNGFYKARVWFSFCLIYSNTQKEI